MKLVNQLQGPSSEQNSVLESHRRLMLLLLAAWIVAVITVSIVLDSVMNVEWYLTYTPAVLIALLMAYIVSRDFTTLDQRGESWDMRRLDLVIATAVFPPFVLAYLWKRGRSIS